ncbi:MacB family efflux pump subunit [Campylobacter hyointestinalis]|uniref:Pyoverdine export ATP-binding/permease protein PvdT n=1 Tax=Campylobacter hyointestinalis subsp. hyointestinalis TaxID=91352 RepID=A0A0S4RGD0_CAMHY|nr:MacB family efflux pump subunit [Campylobacter hyointestinalis]PPB52587.1 macrolide ABC transporter permease/ATP-binding protein MacB [Campylobacter hyointestinalis subsp. hyointestinalis]PPB53818.1 macrolide ABC transporter permease/ATP-binding protein MacB [Campylobacter hyointestinalis subsp. hyointestinalis]PPB59231.1 macrolide ABC transporter permease/ATP-binding protein MacB [Campylobacter hyointestinalis subsp. hyointestinalis]PPB69522.1 macrolide ABC transporter permease/ATP-binding 
MIKLQDIKKKFITGGVETEVLKGINLSINRGEFVAIIGQSGSGKSTLMNILGCLDTPSSGKYLLEGQDISKFDRDALSNLRLKTFGFIFQRYNLLSSNDVKNNVALPGVYAGMGKKDRLNFAKELLSKLGLESKFDTYPNQLSGGQQQRVSIARALMNGGDILLCDEPTGALDSTSGVMVMEILKDLHKSGHTIIVVTHDKDIASWADRIIEIKDGNILSDNKKQNNIYEFKKVSEGIKKGFKASLDRFLESFSMSVGAIKAHKLRSFLTMLGIIIGIASVVCVVALAKGSQEKILNEINKVGTSTIMLNPGKAPGDPNRNKIKKFTLDDAELLSKLEFVDYATPTVSQSGLLVYANQNANANLRAGSENYLKITGVKVVLGRDFSSDDIKNSESVIIIDTDVKSSFFGQNDPIGKTILFNKKPFKIIGVAKKDEGAFGSENLTVYMPYSTAVNKITGDRNLRSITVKLKSNVNAQLAESTIKEVMSVKRGDSDFYTRNSDTIMQTIKSTTDAMSLLISGIALISLMVGGIGVMNIMLVSVFERTKEIGIRMAIGAKSKDIMIQFLIEAILLCAIGGAIGVGLAYLIGYLFNMFGASFKMIFSTSSIFIALGVSSLIGIIFGYMPARNAAKLNPIDALSRE